MLRVGVDLVDVGSIERMIELSGDAFLEMSWTPEEQDYCAGRAERLASRWAAKEATMKALGVGIGDISPLDVEIQSVEGMPPRLALHRSAAAVSERLGIADWSVSLSHEGGWAIAFVIGSGSKD